MTAKILKSIRNAKIGILICYFSLSTVFTGMMSCIYRKNYTLAVIELFGCLIWTYILDITKQRITRLEKELKVL